MRKFIPALVRGLPAAERRAIIRDINMSPSSSQPVYNIDLDSIVSAQDPLLQTKQAIGAAIMLTHAMGEADPANLPKKATRHAVEHSVFTGAPPDLKNWEKVANLALLPRDSKELDELFDALEANMDAPLSDEEREELLNDKELLSEALLLVEDADYEDPAEGAPLFSMLRSKGKKRDPNESVVSKIGNLFKVDPDKKLERQERREDRKEERQDKREAKGGLSHDDDEIDVPNTATPGPTPYTPAHYGDSEVSGASLSISEAVSVLSRMIPDPQNALTARRNHARLRTALAALQAEDSVADLMGLYPLEFTNHEMTTLTMLPYVAKSETGVIRDFFKGLEKSLGRF